MSEDCLYLNVYTPAPRSSDEGGRPVLVWIHGGGLTQDGGRNYDPTKLAADGVVVVTINYRLGALGFLAHPALAARPGGPAGNYGLMDQQAALRWVQANIRRFGGNPHNVTIAGESAGGLSVLAQMVSPGSRGLFQKAIIQSGAFALNQQPLAAAETAGEAFAAKAGCPDQTAACLRKLPVADLVNTPFAGIPGVVDGQVLTEPIGMALAAGRFARVPVLDGTNHDEERIFVSFGRAISGGTNVAIPDQPVTAGNYQTDIAAVLAVPAARAAAIAAQYPPAAYPSAAVAFSTLVGDASFACPALQLDSLTAKRVPTFGYEFNDDAAPQRSSYRRSSRRPWRPTGPSCSTCSSCRTRRSPARSTPASKHSRTACELPGRTSRPAATPRPRRCPGPHSATRTGRPCCRSSRHSHSSRPTSPPGTTVRSGPPASGLRQDHRRSRTSHVKQD